MIKKINILVTKRRKKKMTVFDFIKEKNEWVKERTGVELIPKEAVEYNKEVLEKEQNSFLKCVILLENTHEFYLAGSDVCPHCYIFGDKNCKGCWYEKYDNKCRKGSRYATMIEIFEKKDIFIWIYRV